MDILIINGPNLNLLGKREPGIYGHKSFEDYLATLHQQFPDVHIDYFQSNYEGAIIDRLHDVGFGDTGIVLNAGAYSHYSIAIADAIRAITATVVEVHISNTYSREEFRHKDVLTPVCEGIIAGLGLDGYRVAIDWLIRRKA